VWVDQLRARARGRRHRRTIQDALKQQRETQSASDPAGAAEAAELRGYAEQAATFLRPELREVFNLVAVHGMGSPEIGERLGLAPSSVRARLLKARRILRTALRSELWFQELLGSEKVEVSYGYRGRSRENSPARSRSA
jgi:RNA polymerase sigma factor (sigma-70 family)